MTYINRQDKMPDQEQVREQDQSHGWFSRLLDEHPFWTAVLVNALFVALVMLVFPLHYETNDDQLIIHLLYGSLDGNYSPYLIYINPALSWPLYLLTSHMPAFPWYPVLQYLVSWCSMTVISYVLIRNNRRAGLVLVVGFLCSFALEIYTSMQFTKVGGFATCAGLLLITDTFAAAYQKKREAAAREKAEQGSGQQGSAEQEAASGNHASQSTGIFWLQLLAGLILLYFGIGYRWKQYLILFGFMSPYPLSLLFKQLKEKAFGWIGKEVLMFAVIGAMSLGLIALNNKVYSDHKDWAEYLSFNEVRSQLLDRSFPVYEENPKVYNDVGLSLIDTLLYRNWDFGDPEVVNEEVFTALVEAKTKPVIDKELWQDFFSSYLKGFAAYTWLPAFVLLAVCFAFVPTKKRGWLIFQLLLIGAYSFYLYYHERFLKNRVDLCIFLTASSSLGVLMLQAFKTPKWLTGRKLALAAALAAALFAPEIANLAAKGIYAKETHTEAKEVREMIEADTDHIYLVSLGSVAIWEDGYGIFEMPEAGCMNNICFLGGCYAFTPPWKEQLRQRGIENPFSYGIDNPQVYLYDEKHLQTTITYIQNHYNSQAQAVEAFTKNEHPFYSIRTAP